MPCACTIATFCGAAGGAVTAAGSSVLDSIAHELSAGFAKAAN